MREYQNEKEKVDNIIYYRDSAYYDRTIPKYPASQDSLFRFRFTYYM